MKDNIKENTIKDETKPIDLEAEKNLNDLKEKYKNDPIIENKQNGADIPQDPINNYVDPQMAQDECTMLNEIYKSTFKRDLPREADLCYKMGSLSYQKKYGSSPLAAMDKYPSIYLVGFALAVIKDILVNKKQKKQNIKNDVKADTKVQNNNNPIDEESKSYEQINPIGSVIN